MVSKSIGYCNRLNTQDLCGWNLSTWIKHSQCKSLKLFSKTVEIDLPWIIIILLGVTFHFVVNCSWLMSACLQDDFSGLHLVLKGWPPYLQRLYPRSKVILLVWRIWPAVKLNHLQCYIFTLKVKNIDHPLMEMSSLHSHNRIWFRFDRVWFHHWLNLDVLHFRGSFVHHLAAIFYILETPH